MPTGQCSKYTKKKVMRDPIKAFYEGKYTKGREIGRSSKQFAVDCFRSDHPLDILDVGCGTGLNSLALAQKGHRMTGVDISDAAIEQYRRHGFDGHVADIEAGLEYPDASFDGVLCCEVIEHMTAPKMLISEIARVIKPAGELVLSTPNSAFWLFRLLGLAGYTVSELQHPKHFQFFSRKSLLTLLRNEGFRTKQTLGRNMYMIVPDVPEPFRNILPVLGFTREMRFRTGKSFWHFSRRSKFMNTLFADTLIVVAQKA